MIEMYEEFNIENIVSKFNRELMGYINEVHDEDLRLAQIKEIMKYSLESGGKRLRPLILIEFCKSYGGSFSQALPFAMAIEMIHTYSLIHDDLPSMDNDNMRRGMPTCHVKYGEANAILAGDALLSLAHELMIVNCIPYYEGHFTAGFTKAALTISKAAGISGMINGQVLDIANEKSGKHVDLDTLDYINMKKTGSLFSAAATAGALLGKHDTTDIFVIDGAMKKIGLAFQIIDDVLDITGSNETLGKTPGKDSGSHKTTYPGILGISEARRTAERLKAEAKKELSELGVSMKNIFIILDLMVDRSY